MKRNNAIIYICVIIITLLLLSMLSIYAAASFKASGFSGKISAKAAALYEPSSESFLYTKNGDARLPMASTTKIMTAIIVAESCRMDETILIGPESVGIEGSSAYLREGDEYTVLELTYALLLQSANDAATALAYYVAGGIPEFAELMNAKAESLGLENTHFTNPHGLDDEEHYTCATDLAKIGACLLENELLSEIVSTYKKTFTYGERTRTYINHNKLLLSFDDANGIKTGFTKRCGRCLVGSAMRDGIQLICVTLDAPSDWSDQKEMMEYGFDILESVLICEGGDFAQSVPVLGGSKDSISISAKEDVRIIKEKGKSATINSINIPRYLIAPINEGDAVGEVVFELGDRTYAVEIVANESVSAASRENIFTKIKKIFR